MRFEEAYQGWTEGRLSQAEAALLLGQCERTWSKPPVGEASTASSANARFGRNAGAPGRQHPSLGG
jgi:hypothetical protein